jgi:hypothetical protein
LLFTGNTSCDEGDLRRRADRSSSFMDLSLKEKEMRHLILAAATFGALGLAMVSTAQADNYYGPRQRGNECYIRQNGEQGYWAPCKTGQAAQATNAASKGNSKSASKKK